MIINRRTYLVCRKQGTASRAMFLTCSGFEQRSVCVRTLGANVDGATLWGTGVVFGQCPNEENPA